jgi:ubiquinone/menaquinone biosynthesis C-methylase UbiE
MRGATEGPDPAEYMAMVATTEAGSAYKTLVLRQLRLRPGHVVLDAGCGPATDLIAMHSAVGGEGLVLGLDVDEGMLGIARGRIFELPGVVVAAGDAHALPLRNGVIDRVRTDRALQHMAQPVTVLKEFRRVLRPGGIAVLAEPDWGTLVVDCSEAETSAVFVDYICQEVVRNALIGRQVDQLGRQAGFTALEVAIARAGFGDFPTADKVLGLQRNAVRACRDGYLTEKQAQEWLTVLQTEPMQATVNLVATALTTDG